MTDDLSVTEIDKIKHDKIQKAKQFEQNVNDAINIAKDLKDDVKKIKEEICEGPNCLKKQVTEKFDSIDDKIKKIESNMQYFVCENCSYPNVPALSSYCPNCGSPIFSWEDDEGRPVKGWEHYSEKAKSTA